jgi:hypothetical protein
VRAVGVHPEALRGTVDALVVGLDSANGEPEFEGEDLGHIDHEP